MQQLSKLISMIALILFSNATLATFSFTDLPACHIDKVTPSPFGSLPIPLHPFLQLTDALPYSPNMPIHLAVLPYSDKVQYLSVIENPMRRDNHYDFFDRSKMSLFAHRDLLACHIVKGLMFLQHRESTQFEQSDFSGVVSSLELAGSWSDESNKQIQLGLLHDLGVVQYSGVSDYQLPGYDWYVPFSGREDISELWDATIAVHASKHKWFGLVFKPYYGLEYEWMEDQLPNLHKKKMWRDTMLLLMPIGLDVVLGERKSLRFGYDFFLDGHVSSSDLDRVSVNASGGSGIRVALNYVMNIMPGVKTSCQLQWHHQTYRTPNDQYGFSFWNQLAITHHINSTELLCRLVQF